MVFSISDPVFTNATKLYQQGGFNIFPMFLDGSKAAKTKWGQYHEHRPGWYKVQHWFASLGDLSGIGILCGVASGNLEVLDIEENHIFPELERAVGTEIFGRLVVVQTPSGGFHIYYRCETIEKNLMLARNKAGDLLIETRGIGNMAVAPGSPPSVHPSNKPYRIVSGDILSVPTIPPEDRTKLLTAARGFNTYEVPARPRGAPLDKGFAGLACTGSGTGRPGDDFNIRGDWHEILEPHGWTFMGRTYWRKPGSTKKEHHASARDYLRVFGNVPGFEPDKVYSKYATYAKLNCGDDFSQAARELRARGYGEQAIDYDHLLERIVCPK